MPETPQPPDEEDRPAPSPEAGGAEHEALDVAEWVSELRRLYVEPKTRAEVHQESAIAPLKRKLRLRGPRRTPLPVDVEAGPMDESPPEPVETAAPDSVEPPAPAHEPVTWDLKVDPASVPAPVAPAVDYAATARHRPLPYRTSTTHPSLSITNRRRRGCSPTSRPPVTGPTRRFHQEARRHRPPRPRPRAG